MLARRDWTISSFRRDARQGCRQSRARELRTTDDREALQLRRGRRIRHASRQARINRIFTQIDIQTDWLNCPTSPELMVTNRACAAKPGPDNLTLNLLPRSMSKKYGFNSGIFGFALPTAKGLPGQSISLFIERVLDLSYYSGVGTSFEDAQAIILGHMILHEVGHLLLRPNSHSPSGVMGFPWDKRTLTNMERGRLKFSTGESSKIRKELQRRLDLIADSQTESIHPTE